MKTAAASYWVRKAERASKVLEKVLLGNNQGNLIVPSAETSAEA